MKKLLNILLLFPLLALGQLTMQGVSVSGTTFNDNVVGEIFNESSFASATNFPITGTSITRGTGKLDMTGNPTLFASYIRFDDSNNAHRYTCLENWTQLVRLKVSTTKTATSYGIGIGVRSDNGYDAKSTSVRWSWDNSGAGRVYLYNVDATTNQIISSTSLVATADTYYWVQVTRAYNAITTKIFNDNSGTLGSEAFSVTQTFTMSSGYVVPHNTGRWTIQHFGGDGIEVTDWIVSSREKTGVQVVGVGDSNMHGMHVATVAERFMNIAASTAGRTLVVNAGISDRTAEVILRLPQIKALKPQKVFLSIGRNDIANGVAQATYEANINTIIADLEGAGITVLLGGGIASNVNVSGLQTFYNGKSNTQVNGYTITKSAGTTLNASYNAGDDIHMNTAGNAALGAQVATIL